jgi:hypothetical protein
MTKVDKMSTFEDGTVTTVERPKTRAEKISQWKRDNHAAYKRACDDSHCTCTPTRAQMLIIQQYEGNGPDYLNQ